MQSRCREDAPVNGRRIWVQLSHVLLLLMLVAYVYHVTSINQIRGFSHLFWLYTGTGHGRLPRPWAEPCESRDRQSQNLAFTCSSVVFCHYGLLLSAYQNFIQAMKKEREMSQRQETIPRNRLYYVSTRLFVEIRYCASTYLLHFRSEICQNLCIN